MSRAAPTRIARAAMTAFKADGITIQQFSEPAGGQVVFHLHMHVMPRHDGIALLPPASRKEDAKVLEDNAVQADRGAEGRMRLGSSSRHRDERESLTPSRSRRPAATPAA